MDSHPTAQLQSEAVRPSTWVLFKQLVHLRRFAFTVFLPLMGAATAVEPATMPQIFGIVLASWCFHIFTYVLNDVVDLPVDRLMPKRAKHPLVRGDLKPGSALAIALVNMLLALLFASLIGASPWRMAALGITIVCMAIYDIWGKRFVFPPLTDFIQALSWGALTLFGAFVVGTPSFLTWVLAAIFIVFILLMNGVFEGVIDFAGDRAAGLKTTAIVFGVTAPDATPMQNPDDAKRPEWSSGSPLFIPVSLVIYGIVLEVALIALNLLPLVRNDFGYSDTTRFVIFVIVAVLNVIIVWYSLRLVSPRPRFRKPIKDEHIDVMSALSVFILLVSYVLYMDPTVLAAIAVCTILPLIV